MVESGTIEQTLPGLEPMTPQSDLQVGRALARAPQKRLMLFSGRSNPELAQHIAENLDIELGNVKLKTFANGETYCRYEESVRGADMFIVQTACDPIDRNLVELLIMINAARLASVRRITAVIPWYFYARQDKKSRPREPISARLVADMLQAAGADRVLTMDLHAGQVQGFFHLPVDHMTAVPLFAQYVRDLKLSEPLAAVSPDTGRTKLAGKFAEMIDGDLVVLNKERPEQQVARVTTVIGDVEGKIAVMTDDIVDTAGTLVAGAQALKEAGALKVYACATHGLFNGPALERIASSEIDRLVVTDTVPVDPLTKPDNVEILTVAGILADTISNVFTDESVSAIFAGENQLFWTRRSTGGAPASPRPPTARSVFGCARSLGSASGRSREPCERLAAHPRANDEGGGRNACTDDNGAHRAGHGRRCSRRVSREDPTDRQRDGRKGLGAAGQPRDGRGNELHHVGGRGGNASDRGACG